MEWTEYYLLMIALTAMYVLGRMHERGDANISGVFLALITGIVWPFYVGYSIWYNRKA